MILIHWFIAKVWLSFSNQVESNDSVVDRRGCLVSPPRTSPSSKARKTPGARVES